MSIQFLQDQLSVPGSVLTYSPIEAVCNIALAALLGGIVAIVYKQTHKGLSYSQSFTQTILLVAVVVAIVMMVIGSSLARAFALVGALSIIRFRTVIKDTRDMAFVFAGLAVGMAAGTSNYFLAGIATVFLFVISWGLYSTNFGALYKSEFILRFLFDQAHDSRAYVEKIHELAKRSSLLHLEPTGDGAQLKLTFDITLKKDVTAEMLTTALAKTPGASEVVLIVAKNDVDY
jgi:uncharacterized membrane protein YhiD involved in acid resistance